MSNSLLFLPDLFCFLSNLVSKQWNLDTNNVPVLSKLVSMKNYRGLLALLSIALILASLIVVIIVKFYVGHY